MPEYRVVMRYIMRDEAVMVAENAAQAAELAPGYTADDEFDALAQGQSVYSTERRGNGR